MEVDLTIWFLLAYLLLLHGIALISTHIEALAAGFTTCSE